MLELGAGMCSNVSSCEWTQVIYSCIFILVVWEMLLSQRDLREATRRLTNATNCVWLPNLSDQLSMPRADIEVDIYQWIFKHCVSNLKTPHKLGVREPDTGVRGVTWSLFKARKSWRHCKAPVVFSSSLLLFCNPRLSLGTSTPWCCGWRDPGCVPLRNEWEPETAWFSTHSLNCKYYSKVEMFIHHNYLGK